MPTNITVNSLKRLIQLLLLIYRDLDENLLTTIPAELTNLINLQEL